MDETAPDAAVARLAKLFGEHPAWVEAARHLGASATSNVWFSHVPGEPHRLEFADGRARMLPGRGPDPDLVFRFTPAAVTELEAVQGGIGEFAVRLFELILEDDADLAVGFRIAAPFHRLLRRGYARLLLAAGPRVAAFGATHGIASLPALGRFVADVRRKGPQPWELYDG